MDDLVFDNTKAILKRGDEYFYTTTKRHLCASSGIDLNGLELFKIPVDSIWTKFDPSFTRASEPLPHNCYVKQPRLLHYGYTAVSLILGNQLLSEAEAFEILRRYPHPNIAQYLGCVVNGGKINGLCFIRYSMTLPRS
jgi:hypothetical protein